MPAKKIAASRNGVDPAVRRTALTPQGRKVVRFVDPVRAAQAYLYARIVGETPLLVSAFSEKAQQWMLAKQEGKARGKKPPKEVEQDFLNSMHFIGKKPTTMEEVASAVWAFPALAFKAALVRGLGNCGEKMTLAKTAIYVPPADDDPTRKLVRILSESGPRMTIDPVRNATGVADLRTRAEFVDWAVDLVVRFDSRTYGVEQVCAGLSAAGLCGVGDWRPNGKESTGMHGMFRLESAEAEMPGVD